MVEMLYQGHGSYRFVTDEGIVVYVDPFAGKPEWYREPAHLILVTHEHYDHTAIDLMPHAAGCEVYRAADVHPAPDAYLSLSSHGIRFTAVQAYNLNHPAEECVGFVIDFGHVTFYASGDTSTTEEMSSGRLAAMGIDYAVLPGDGIYNMDVAEASACARMINACHTIPIHLEPVSAPEDTEPPFPRNRAEAFDGPGKIILEPGDTLQLR
jgi:L-ascorbate metabolism protein UlaG (beta-lactamase superfamily)